MGLGLADLQEQLSEHLCGRGGASRILGQIVGAGALDPEGALAIYADSVRTRFVSALITGYPMTFRWLGRERGLALAHDYCAALPATGGEIAKVGEDFPERSALVALGPELVDLARLERARDRAATRAPLPALSVVSAEAALLGARLAPSASMFTVSSDVIGAWEALFEGELPPPLPGCVRHVIVWRSGLMVRQQNIDAEMFLGLLGREDPALMERWCREGLLVPGDEVE